MLKKKITRRIITQSDLLEASSDDTEQETFHFELRSTSCLN